MSRLAQLESIKDLIQDGVDRTVQSVETIHQNVLDFPFAAFEGSGDENGELNARVRQAREAKTRVISSIYGLVRQINSDVGELLSDLIGSVEDHADVVVDIQDAPADAQAQNAEEDSAQDA